MRNIRTARICARAAIALAVLSAVGSATAAPRAVFLEALPAIATGAGQTVVAWTAGGVVQIASQNSDGSFTPGSAVGRTLGSQSPQIAITPAGEQVLVWQSGRTLRSAVRYSPQTAWKLQKIAGAGRFVDPHLVMGPTGRAIVTWVTDTGAPSTTSSLWESTRLPHESWSAPVLLVGPAILAGGSTAVDSDGDVAVVYASVPSFGPNAGSERFSVWAIELAAGADAWTPPVVISGADVLGSNGPFVAGGGSRTFVATWRAANVAPKAPSEPESLLHTARLRLPGAWEAPQTLVAPESKLSAFANAGLGAVGVDSAGDALAIVRYGSSEHGLALDSVRLPSTADAWDAPVVVDVPERVEMNDSPPALVLGQNASATVVFLRGLLVGTTLRVAALAAGGAWQGQGTDLAQLDSCSKSLYPDGSITCPLGAETVPVVASGSPVSVVAVQTFDGVVRVLTQSALGAPWSGPTALVPAGRTEASLRAGTARPGTVQVVATCALPPCFGVAVLRLRDRPNAELARVPFTLLRAGTAARRILLPAWARGRLAHGPGLWTRVIFNVHEGDGTSEQTRLPFLLSGKRWIRVREGG